MRSILVVTLVVVLVSVVLADHPKGDDGLVSSSSSSLEGVYSADSASLEPHKRSKRTIGHIFDMFRKMMDNMFGGGGGKGKGKGNKGGRGRRPGAPSGGYGAPAASSGYGAPAAPSRPSYGGGSGSRQPPRNPGLSGGYAGGQPPQRPQSAPNGYGGPSQSAPSGYGGPSQSAPNGYGGPSQQTQNIDSYGSPQAAPIGGNQDSYGSPQAAPVGPSSFGRGQRPQSTEFGPSSVFYELPAPNLATQAPSVNSALSGYGQQLTPNQDSYGSPQAPALNSGAQDPYGSPQAPALNSAQDSYGSPQAPALNSGAQDSYGSPQAPALNSGAQDSYGSPQAPALNSAAGDSYGSPQAGVISLNSAQPAPASNNYGSPQFNSAPANSNYGSPQFNSAPAQNSYGSPQFNSAPASNNYGGPQANSAPIANSYANAAAPAGYGSPQVNSAPASNNFAPAPAVNSNPFIRQPSYGNNAAPLPVTVGNSLSGNFVPSNYGQPQTASNVDSYGSPSVGSSLPTTDIDLPVTNPIVIAGRGQTNNNNLDIYGSPVAPVGTSAPVPAEIISAERQPDSFESYNNNVDLVDIRDGGVDNESGNAPVGELTSTNLAGTGEASPLFENLRNVEVTKADETTESGAIQVDLSDGVVDLTNGYDDNSVSKEVDLLTKYGDDETTAGPSYEYEDEYIGDENVPPEIPDELLDLRSEDVDEAGDEKLAVGQNPESGSSQESYGGGQESNTLSENSEYYETGEGDYYYEDDEYGEIPPDQAGTTQANYQPTSEAPRGDSEGPSYISVPLMIEEVKDSAAAPVILAGTERDAQPQYGQGDRNGQNSKRGASFHQYLTVNDPVVAAPSKFHNKDWSQRIESRRKQRVWRQFHLD